MPVGNSNFQNIKIKPLHIKGAETLKFHSIITEFADAWNPKWSPTEVYGRMDPISFFSSVSREMTLGFRVISDDVPEAKKNMEKAQKLIQYQYPRYKSVDGGGKVLHAPPYFEFEFLNVLRSNSPSGNEGARLYGYINSAVQINPGFQTKDQAQFFDYPAEAKPETPPDRIYFSDFTITLRIQVLHAGKSIGWNNNTFSDAAYPYGVVDESPPAAPAVAPNPTAAAAGSASPTTAPGATTSTPPAATSTASTPVAKKNAQKTKNLAALKKAAPGISIALQNVLNNNQKLGGVSGRGSFKPGGTGLLDAISKP